MLSTRSILFVAASLALVGAVQAMISVPPVISSFMVLQRDTNAVIWGWGTPAQVISMTLIGPQTDFSAQITPSQTGEWQVLLPPTPAGTDFTVTLADIDNEVVLQHVAFGDVILCSGQSNMELTVAGAYNATAEIADSINYPNLRFFTLAKITSWTPLNDMTSKDASFNWTVSGPGAFTTNDPWTVESATCYFTGRSIYKVFGGSVPIGLVASDWGGTRVQAWSSPDALAKCPSEEGEEEEYVPSESDLVDGAPAPGPNNASVLWNGMIEPILPMRFNAAIWYQGEANAGEPTKYACNFPAMITDWRVKFDLPLPFFFVQLAAYAPGGAEWPLIQIAQTAALKLENVGMATAMDLGDPTSPNGDIHPRDKQTVGARLAFSILDIVYGADIPSTGPIPTAFSMTAPDALTVSIKLDNTTTTSGIHFNGTENCGYQMPSGGCCKENPFELGTTNGNWYRATQAVLDEPDVLQVTIAPPADEGKVVAIRYAFEAYPQCALYNAANLPMTVFTSNNIAVGPAPPPIKNSHKIILTE